MTSRRESNVIPLGAVLAVVVLVLVVLFLASQQRECDFEYVGRSEDLYLVIETNKDVYRKGEDVLFSLVLVNDGSDDFSDVYSGRSWELVVLSSTGKEVVNSATWKDTTDVNFIEVPANSQVAIATNSSWDQTTDPTSLEHGEALPRDCYLLRFSFKGHYDLFGEKRILIE